MDLGLPEPPGGSEESAEGEPELEDTLEREEPDSYFKDALVWVREQLKKEGRKEPEEFVLTYARTIARQKRGEAKRVKEERARLERMQAREAKRKQKQQQ